MRHRMMIHMPPRGTVKRYKVTLFYTNLPNLFQSMDRFSDPIYTIFFKYLYHPFPLFKSIMASLRLWRVNLS